MISEPSSNQPVEEQPLHSSEEFGSPSRTMKWVGGCIVGRVLMGG